MPNFDAFLWWETQAFLIAKDFGVRVAQFYAVLHPERVAGIVTLGIPLVPQRPAPFQEYLPEGFYISRWQVKTSGANFFLYLYTYLGTIFCLLYTYNFLAWLFCVARKNLWYFNIGKKICAPSKFPFFIYWLPRIIKALYLMKKLNFLGTWKSWSWFWSAWS